MTHEAVLHIFGGIISKDAEKLRSITSNDGLLIMHAGQISHQYYDYEVNCDDGTTKRATGKLVEGIMIIDTSQSGTMFVNKQPPSLTPDEIEQVEHLIVFKPASQCKFIVSDPFKNDPYNGILEEGKKIIILPRLYPNEQTFSEQ